MNTVDPPRIGNFFHTHFMNSLFRLMLLVLSCASAHAASLQMNMSSQFLARGEQAVLEVLLSEIEPPDTLILPKVEGVSIQSRGFGGPNATILPGRKLGYIYQFQVSSFEVGKHQIPPVSLSIGSKTYTSNALEFEIFEASAIRFSELRIGSEVIPYAAFFRTTKDNPYVGEILPIELKIYFPSNIRVDEWGIPDFDRSGITAWRFEPRPQLGNAILLGANYQCASYPSTMSASSAGKVTMGPAKIRLISVQNVMGQFGFEQNAIPLNLQAEALELTAQPLPDNAPADFRNAVGSFTLDARLPETEVREGDPIHVELVVSGRGNLDSMEAPVLTDPEGWKLYEANRSELGEERRLQQGTVQFKQFMRPTARQTLVPPFRLVYFDPSDASYKTLTTSPIPLKVLPSTAPAAAMGAAVAAPPAANVPVEAMTDILGLIHDSALLKGPQKSDITRFWHLLPLLVLVILLAAIFRRHYWPRWQLTDEQKRRREAWKALQSAPDHRTEFLRQAGRFIEVWLPQLTHKEEIQQILQERDESCFRPTAGDAPILPSRRQEILSTLKKIAFTLLIFAIALAPNAQGAEPTSPALPPATAYEQGKYREAIAAWLAAGPYESLSADTLYHIGNACYRAGSQGHAALYYRRALAVEPGHAEAQQNLRFLERKFGALTIKRPNYQHTLTKVPKSYFEQLLYASLWLAALSLLTIPATSAGSRWRIAAILSLLVCPILTFASLFAQKIYPDDSIFAPLEEQAVVVMDQSTVYAEASRTSGKVIEVPAGSLCRIIRRSDRWVYIAFATQTRGWVPADQIEQLIPTSPPTVPDFSKVSQPKGPSA
ncbi:MAG: hypothetical protein EAZ81_03720 [Verrucomicrobia bacterium]|nr:MAG: hypothetical protein EAZ81_03720 [Verrucomicrobiota bacterium]